MASSYEYIITGTSHGQGLGPSYMMINDQMTTSIVHNQIYGIENSGFGRKHMCPCVSNYSLCRWLANH